MDNRIIQDIVRTYLRITSEIREDVRVIKEREGENYTQGVLDEYSDPCSERYAQMLEDICKIQNFTSLRYHRLDDLLASIGIEPCKVCTYCFNGKE